MPDHLHCHGSFESLRPGGGTEHRGALCIDVRDLGQRAVFGAQDEATSLRNLDLNLCNQTYRVVFRYTVFLQRVRVNGL